MDGGGGVSVGSGVGVKVFWVGKREVLEAVRGVAVGSMVMELFWETMIERDFKVGGFVEYMVKDLGMGVDVVDGKEMKEAIGSLKVHEERLKRENQNQRGQLLFTLNELMKKENNEDRGVFKSEVAWWT
ncbi:hypothetical protein AgCh_022811 [Apium graveolens]